MKHGAWWSTGLAIALAVSAGAQESGTDLSEAARALQTWIGLGQSELRAGRYDSAVDAFQHALNQDPKNRDARLGLGTAYIQQGRFREALEVLEAMLEEFPADFSLRNNLAWLYATAKDPSVRNGARAVALAQEALLLAPRDYHVWNTLAEAYYVSGHYEKALRAAREALSLARDARLPAEALREYLDQVAKCEKAVEAFSLLE